MLTPRIELVALGCAVATEARNNAPTDRNPAKRVMVTPPENSGGIRGDVSPPVGTGSGGGVGRDRRSMGGRCGDTSAEDGRPFGGQAQGELVVASQLLTDCCKSPHLFRRWTVGAVEELI